MTSEQNYQEDPGMLSAGESPQKGGDPYADQDVHVLLCDSSGGVTPFRGAVKRDETGFGLSDLLARCMEHANTLENCGLKDAGEDVRRLVRKFS